MLLLNAYSIYCQTVVQIKDILANLSYSYRRRHSGTCFSTHAITDARGAVYKIDVQLKKKYSQPLNNVSLPLPPPSVLLMKLCRDFMAYHPNAHTHTIQVQNERHRKGDESLINEPASQVVLAESARDNSNIWMYTGQWIRCMILTGWSF